MIVYTDLSQVRIKDDTVLALGKFDGVHLGHRRLIERLISERRRLGEGWASCALIIGGSPDGGLVSEERQLDILGEMGVDIAVRLPFDRKLAGTPAEDFLRDVLLGALHMKVMVAGPDVTFGAGAEGDLAFLRAREETLGFRLVIIEKEEYCGSPVSSTRIRNALAMGEEDAAAAMLGGR